MKGSSAPTSSTPTSRDSDLTSPTQVSWLHLRLKVVELAVPWASIVCARLNASAFVQCNSTSSSLPTRLHCAFGKILDLQLSVDCRARFATPRTDLSMFM